VALPPGREGGETRLAAARLRRIWLSFAGALRRRWIGLLASQVSEIGLATGVAVPAFVIMVTASAIATVEEPRRAAWSCSAPGSPLGSRCAGGKRADLALYVKQVRGLLNGDVVEIDGDACQMLHSPDQAPTRPIHVPLGLAPIGPKGTAVSRQLADGVVLTAPPGEDEPPWTRAALLVNGTVLDPEEDHLSPRVIEAAGPAYVTGVPRWRHGRLSWWSRLRRCRLAAGARGGTSGERTAPGAP
jgi:5,10-methylenetetrahydromethanopterin reductase